MPDPATVCTLTFSTPASAALSPLWTSVLWTAAGVVIAALVAALLARTLKISEFRQAWINALREDVADLIGSVRTAHEASVRAGSEFSATSKPIWDLEFTPAIGRSYTLLSRIRLRINPKENKHSGADKRFLTACTALVDGCKDRAAPCSDLQDRITSAESEARLLLKREWQATKFGKWL